MSAVADAVKRLQEVRFEDPRVQQLLQQTPFLDDTYERAIGGPRDGYSQDLYDFLTKLVARHQKRVDAISTIERIADGASIKSAQDPNLEFAFTQQDLATISKTTALSHNDLEPRNILVRCILSSDAASEPQYELAAIIDWETAGFMPFTFEFGWKDEGLGASSIYWDRYKMFKQETCDLIPGDECSQRLLRALHFVVEAKRESMKRNANAEICRRWRAQEGTEWAEDVGGSILDGWDVRHPSKFSKEGRTRSWSCRCFGTSVWLKDGTITSNHLACRQACMSAVSTSWVDLTYAFGAAQCVVPTCLHYKQSILIPRITATY